MIALTIPASPDPAFTGRVFARLGAWRRGDPVLFGLGVLLLALVLPTGFAALVDPRLFNGIAIWEKPFKFELALALYALTLALYAHALSGRFRASWGYRVFRGAVVAAILGETAVIGGGAVLGTASHFNPTPIGQTIYGLMGVGAVLLTAASAVFAFGIARNPAAGLAPVLKEGLVIGLALTLPLTLLTAGTMSAMGSHHVGGAGSDAGGLFLLGWSRTGGDLRAAHFLGTHAMHAVPLFALASARLRGPDRKAPVRLFAAVFALLTVYAFVEALGGHPFLPFLG